MGSLMGLCIVGTGITGGPIDGGIEGGLDIITPGGTGIPIIGGKPGKTGNELFGSIAV